MAKLLCYSCIVEARPTCCHSTLTKLHPMTIMLCLPEESDDIAFSDPQGTYAHKKNRSAKDLTNGRACQAAVSKVNMSKAALKYSTCQKWFEGNLSAGNIIKPLPQNLNLILKKKFKRRQVLYVLHKHASLTITQNSKTMFSFYHLIFAHYINPHP